MEPKGPGEAASAPADSTFSLLQRAQAGDRSAVDRLFSRYLPRLQRRARGRLPSSVHDMADTQDLVQEEQRLATHPPFVRWTALEYFRYTTDAPQK
jgi:hypothetical protein